MSWDDISTTQESGKKAAKEHAAKASALAKQYATCFSTEQGKAILEHLINVFVMDSSVSLDAKNVNYEAAYRNGEAGVVKYILNQIKRAQTL